MPTFVAWMHPTRPYVDKLMPVFCTLDELKADMGSSVDTSDENLKHFIEVASSVIVKYCNRTFIPYEGTRIFAWSSPYRVNMMEDVLSVASFTDASGAIPNSAYTLSPRFNCGRSIYMKEDQTLVRGDLTLVGTFGFHDRPDEMWKANVTTMAEDITLPTDTDVTVADVSNFSEYQYIQINNEVMLITDIDEGTKTLTLLRGQRGTTATTHTSGDSVDTYRHVNIVNRACRELAHYLYENSSTVTNSYVTDNDEVTIADGLPHAVRTALDTYRII